MAKQVSNKGVNLIKEFEGLYLTAYKDPVGVWTIGYGITNADKSITGTTIKSGLHITEGTADLWLKQSLNKKYVPLVMKYDKIYNWTQNELDALVSFAYNIGSIDQLTAKGTRSKATISAKLLEYNKAGGRVLAGLTRRREAEKAMFDGKATSTKKGYEEPTIAITSVANAQSLGINNYMSRGDGVKWVQNRLIKSSKTTKTIKELVKTNGGVDGICGAATVKAIKKFQKHNKLTADGVVGKKTREVLKK